MRPPDSEPLRGFPRSWFCRALWEYGGNLTDLNAQLALKPDPDRAFRVNEWPRPYYPAKAAPPFFDRALAGRNPDNWEWIDRADASGCFNLFLRVATYLPGSEDWLFRGLHPYLRSTPPAIDYAYELLDTCLQRLGLRVLPQEALETLLRLEPDQGRIAAHAGVDQLAAAAEPIHLMTLYALWHLAHWEKPDSHHSRDLGLACLTATQRFLNRPEFRINGCTREAARKVDYSLWEVRRVIRVEGFRVPRATKGQPKLGFFPLLIGDFEDRDAAIECASLATAIPILHFVTAEPAPYRQDVLPSAQEIGAVTDRLLAAAELRPEDLVRYSRDPQVLKELVQPSERPAVRKRVSTRS